MKIICSICGVAKEYHHKPQWRKVPDRCVCDPLEWEGDIHRPCKKYVGDGLKNCQVCEHDKGCHKK